VTCAEAFGWIKQYIQDNSEEALNTPWVVLIRAFNLIGPALALQYFEDMRRKLEEC